MRADPRLTGYLTRALSHEMAMVQQYLMQAKVVGLWGMQDLSARFRQDVAEELDHADRLMDAMIKRGILPNGSQLPPVRIGRTLEDMLVIDQKLEQEAIDIYREGIHYCERLRISEEQELFADILKDELHHSEELKAMLNELPKDKRAAR
jgi:bacterioferritin